MASVENQEQRTAAIAGAGSVLGRDIVHGLAAKGSPTAEKTIAYALLGMTMVTGLVDAVSFLSLGRAPFCLLRRCCAIGYRRDLLEHSFQPFALIALTALAMGTRNAAVRKLAIPDLTTAVLTLTITRHRRGLFARERRQPEVGKKG
jgi:uncharacterized membrane protein YoaK (UPF0700 family)